MRVLNAIVAVIEKGNKIVTGPVGAGSVVNSGIGSSLPAAEAL